MKIEYDDERFFLFGECALPLQGDEDALQAHRKADGGHVLSEGVREVIVSAAAQDGRAEVFDEPRK